MLKIESITSSTNTTYRCPYCTSNFCIKTSAERHILRMHDDEYNLSIPCNFKKRLRTLEEKADEMMPGDYTIRANFFTDDEGRDVHLVAVHNVTAGNQELEYFLHENHDEIRVDWTVRGDIKNLPSNKCLEG